MLYIYTQDRKAIVPVNTELKIRQYYGNTTECGIFCNGVVLGEYKSLERAENVLLDIVICIDKNCKIYNMPKE